MIIAKQNPVALDVVIHRLQTVMHKAFDVKWSEGQNTQDGIFCYPRCYINFSSIKNGDKIIEHFEANSDSDENYSHEYKEILDVDSNKMIVLHTHDLDNVNESTVFKQTHLELIFIVNLEKAYPAIKHRADEELRRDITKVIEKVHNTTIRRSIRGLNKVFGDLKYPIALDMHPMHCFKIVLSVDRFSDNEKMCINK